MTKSRDLADNAQNTKPKVVDAKGDLLVGTGSDAADRLAVSDNGSTLVADDSTSTGLRWQVPKMVNPLINGGQDFWQRGTSFTTTAAYTYCSDRWYYSRGSGNTTVSRQTDAPSGFQYSIRLARNSGDTATNQFSFHTALETADSLRFAGKTVTFSFWAKKGADYSGTTPAVYINTGTGTDQAASGQNAGTWTGFTSPLNGSTFTPTTSWVRYSFSATIGSTAKQIGVGFLTSAFSGTAGANDWIQFTGLQLEEGSVATPFSRSGGTIQGELAACQRYYFRSTPSSGGGRTAVGSCQTTTAGQFVIHLPTNMRVAPTALETSGTAGDYSVRYQATTITCSAVPTFDSAQTDSVAISFSVASGLTAGDVVLLRPANTSAYLGWSAEL